MGSREQVARRIAEERRVIQVRLREIDHRMMNGVSGGHPIIVEHPRDDFERVQLDLLKAQEMREYELLAARAKVLDRAWESLRRGTYGICRRCGSRIPPRRLEAVPEAALCIACQEEAERAA